MYQYIEKDINTRGSALPPAISHADNEERQDEAILEKQYHYVATQLYNNTFLTSQKIFLLQFACTYNEQTRLTISKSSVHFSFT